MLGARQGMGAGSGAATQTFAPCSTSGGGQYIIIPLDTWIPLKSTRIPSAILQGWPALPPPAGPQTPAQPRRWGHWQGGYIAFFYNLLAEKDQFIVTKQLLTQLSISLQAAKLLWSQFYLQIPGLWAGLCCAVNLSQCYKQPQLSKGVTLACNRDVVLLHCIVSATQHAIVCASFLSWIIKLFFFLQKYKNKSTWGQIDCPPHFSVESCCKSMI